MSTPDRQVLANAIRILSADAVQQANSGHPGAPMGMADIAEVLWNSYFNHNPSDPKWPNRDRFVLSNGHGSMLIYSLLHLSGYDVSLDDVKNFRQLHSKTPGHPEYGYTPGIETTTGPLGQGIANAVGMAIAERKYATEFNTAKHALIDHFTYVFMGDGCMMEGISHEACSLAGTLGLGKLVAFWDDNGISIDGEVDGWFTDDTKARFEAYGWQVIAGVDGHDAASIQTAIETAQTDLTRPSLICCKTIIGKGSPSKQGSESCHGAPLGADELVLVREQLNWSDEPFHVPSNVYSAWDAKQAGQAKQSEWEKTFADYSDANPKMAKEFQRRVNGQLPDNWAADAAHIISKTDQAAATLATRKSSLNALNDFGPLLSELIGGSADLAGSNYTIWSGSKGISRSDYDGNYLYFGVREFAMSAISNGLALYGGLKPYAGTFLVFSDYMRNGMRMSALMKQPVTYVLTHDSIGLGEDGPTHQPIEHCASLRLIPNMSLWRPCDAVESVVAWKVALEATDKPSSLVFSRQNLPHQNRSKQQIADIERGAYVLRDSESSPTLIMIATGSEVALAMDSVPALEQSGERVRVVSMPSTDVFDAQDTQYKASVLPPECERRVALEAGSTDGWYKYVGLKGAVVGMTSFGESAPAEQLFEHFGFTVDNVVATVANLSKQGRRAPQVRRSLNNFGTDINTKMPILKMLDQSLAGKRVLIRQDLNVPMSEGKVTNDARIVASLPTLKAAFEAGAKVMLMSHLGRPTEGQFESKYSLSPVAECLAEHLQVPVRLCSDWLTGVEPREGEIVLCENVRFNAGEKANDESLARQMAALCEVFVMDAFGTAHRAQASTHGVAAFAPIACAGPLLVNELEALAKAFDKPARPVVAIVGGSKVSTKLTVLESLSKQVDQLIVGGGIANTFIAAAGHSVGNSLYEADLLDEAKRLTAAASANGAMIPIPSDVVCADEFSASAPASLVSVDAVQDQQMILDIGPDSAAEFAKVLEGAGTIVWNGPVGVFEFPAFANGTEVIAKAVANSKAFSIAGGGDTVAAIELFGVQDDISYISTGGGAFLEFLEGKQLPAVAILEQRGSEQKLP